MGLIASVLIMGLVACAIGWFISHLALNHAPLTLHEHKMRIKSRSTLRRLFMDAPKRFTKESRANWVKWGLDESRLVVEYDPVIHALLPKGMQGARLYRATTYFYKEPLVALELRNSSPEPNGSFKHYLIRIDPFAYNQRACIDLHSAIASTYRRADGRLFFTHPYEYKPSIET